MTVPFEFQPRGDDDPSFRSFHPNPVRRLREAAAALTSTGDANVSGGQTSETPLDVDLSKNEGGEEMSEI